MKPKRNMKPAFATGRFPTACISKPCTWRFRRTVRSACADAGRVDLRQNAEGKLSFIEVNPLPGLNPVHSDLPILARMHGVTFEKLMGMILDARAAAFDSLECQKQNTQPTNRAKTRSPWWPEDPMRIVILHNQIFPDAGPDTLDTLVQARLRLRR